MLGERLDDLEQYSRKPSVRVYGVPESTNGSTDQKLLQLFNDVMCLSPRIQLEDIEVSHRVGKPSTPKLQTTEESPDAATNQEDGADLKGQGNSAPIEPPAPLRSIIVRFASRRVKASVMAAKKDLRSVGSKEGDHSKNFPFRVYISDDLTRNRARLAYKARSLVKAGKTASTWIFEGRVLLKDNHNKIHEAKPED